MLEVSFMTPFKIKFLIATALLLIHVRKAPAAELEPPCVANSPERRGEIGCSIVEDKPLPTGLKEPLFWHIDRFDSGEQARTAVGPTSIALKAHGTWWLLSVESKSDQHHNGSHVVEVALPPLPPAPKYSLLVISAYIPQGMTSRVHHHSGVETFYTVDGEQCLETPTRAYKMPKGASLAVPAGVPMRLVANGSVPRRALAAIVYDAAQPPTTRMDMEYAKQLASCELPDSK